MATERTVRVFISSPGDVEVERRRAAAVTRRLDREFRRFFTVQPYLWEQEAQRSSGHFQDYIQPPSEFDIVVLILWSRLGTPLPAHTSVREYHGSDGRTPVTGTELEYEEARTRAERDSVPALLVFRNESETPVSSTDAALRELKQEQLEALDEFWRRHFEDRGVFLSAFSRYEKIEQFEALLETQLRKVLQELSQKQATDGAATPISWFDRPFRGLAAYDFEHAAIFYGRDAAVRMASEQLVAAAAAGTAFLLVRGASGSGKSSLVRAGLLPELYVPRSVSGVGGWRRVLFQPRENPGDLFLGIARRLAETGPGMGLAEMLSADFTVEKLAKHLYENSASPAAPFEQALGQLATAMLRRGELLDGEKMRLILVVDQLEELFTFASIADEQRKRFVTLLGGLARSGVVWVVSTMRSDFWHRVGELPELCALTNDGRQLDLWPPNAAELTEIIRRPAAAAGLQFGDDDHRVSLNSRLAEDAASAPGVLPLLSYTLEMLYERDIEAAHGRILTWDSYRELGFLKGAIAHRAEQAVASLAPQGVDEAVIAHVLRRLVTLDEAEAGRPVARLARLNEFSEGTPERLLVDEFLSAATRLFVAEGDLEEARVRVAHEALLTEWERAKRLIAVEGVQLARRRRLERAERDWHNARQEDKPSLLLARGLPLSEAEALHAAWGDELDASLRTYIVASRQAVDEAERRHVEEQRRQLEERAAASRRIAIVSSAAAIGFLILSIIGVYLWRRASDEAQNVLARQLAAQAELAMRESPNLQDRSLLLAVESVRRGPSFEGSQALRAALNGLAKPRARFPIKGEVGAIMFSPDGQLLAIGLTNEKAVQVFAIADNREVVRFPHEDSVTSVAFSPNGKQIATAAGTQARLFDIDDHREVAHVTLGDLVTAVTFSLDGKLLAVGGDDKSTHVVDTANGREVARFDGDKPVKKLNFTGTGHNVAILSEDRPAHKTLRLLEIASGHDVITPTEPFEDVVVSGDGRVLAITSSNDKETMTRVLDLESGVELFRFQHDLPIDKITLSQDGAYLIAARGLNGGLLVYAVKKGTTAPIENIRVPSDVFNVQFLGPRLRYVAITNPDRTTDVVDLVAGHVSVRLLHTYLNHLTFSADGNAAALHEQGAAIVLDLKASATTIIANSDLSSARLDLEAQQLAAFKRGDSTIHFFDQRDGTSLGAPLNENSAMRSIAFSADGHYAVIGLDDEPAQVIELKDRQQVARLGGHKSVSAAAFSHDGRYVAIGVDFGKSDEIGAWLFDTKTWKEVRQLSSKPVCSLAFTADARYVAVGEDSGLTYCSLAVGTPLEYLGSYEGVSSQVNIIDVDTGNVFASMSHPTGTPSLAFSPDGRYLLIGSMNNKAILYDVPQHRTAWEIQDQGRIVAVVFSPDGRFAATTSTKGMTRVFEVADGHEVARVDRGSLDLGFSPDSRALAMLSGTARRNVDELTRVPLLISDLLAQACATLTRNLTREEWARYLPGESYRATCPNVP